MDAESGGESFDGSVRTKQSGDVPEGTATRSDGSGSVNESFSSGHDLRVVPELRHESTTKVDGSNEITASTGCSIVGTSITTLEAADKATSEDPSPHPELVVPEASGEELVGSSDLASVESVGPSNSSSIPHEQALKCGALGDSEEGIDSSLEELHTTNPSPVASDFVDKTVDPVLGSVQSMRNSVGDSMSNSSHSASEASPAPLVLVSDINAELLELIEDFVNLIDIRLQLSEEFLRFRQVSFLLGLNHLVHGGSVTKLFEEFVVLLLGDQGILLGHGLDFNI